MRNHHAPIGQVPEVRLLEQHIGDIEPVGELNRQAQRIRASSRRAARVRLASPMHKPDS
jgi:hypothetical protein